MGGRARACASGLLTRLLWGLQLHVAISRTSAKVVIDCKTVAEKSVNAAGNISTDGVEVLGRTVRSRGDRDSSAPVRSGGALGGAAPGGGGAPWGGGSEPPPLLCPAPAADVRHRLQHVVGRPGPMLRASRPGERPRSAPAPPPRRGWTLTPPPPLSPPEEGGRLPGLAQGLHLQPGQPRPARPPRPPGETPDAPG